MIGSIAVSVTICDSIHHVGYRRLVGAFLSYLGAAVPGIMAVRVLPRLLQDGIAVLQRHQGRNRSRERVVLYGAGFRATLLLREQSFRSGDRTRDRHIEGIIDDDPNIQGRLVHNLPVLGNLEALPRLARERGLCGVIITADVGEQKRVELVGVCAEAGIRVWEWRPVMSEVSCPSGT